MPKVQSTKMMRTMGFDMATYAFALGQVLLLCKYLDSVGKDLGSFGEGNPRYGRQNQ